MKKQYRPMLAESAREPFSSEDWIFEIKWDGIRAVSYLDKDGGLSIKSRNGLELSQNFPELGELKDLARGVVLDGEIVVMKGGKADFQAVIQKAKASGRREIERLSAGFPATYVVFDLLEVGGEDVTGKPLMDRKMLLKEALREGKHVVISSWFEGNGAEYFKVALARGVEGVMAKRKGSVYAVGTRSSDWLKIKKLRTCDCVVVGYTEGKGARKGLFGALMLGLHDGGVLSFVGKVGTGFTEGSMRELMEVFKTLSTVRPTVTAPQQGVTWLRARVVVEVAYQAVTAEGRLRMPRFKGVRLDKKAEECTMDQIKPKLEKYEAKRNFSVTKEPMGGDAKGSSGMYVVQEHHARRLHYDLRLERDGVLKSWAVPKGIPESMGEKRLAIEVEDHPLEYGSFEGTIPEGQYGAGTVSIWDKGGYETIEWVGDMIEIMIRGKRLKGRYVLTRFKKAGDKQWLLFKAREKVD